jgi:hypothetical protein
MSQRGAERDEQEAGETAAPFKLFKQWRALRHNVT